MVAPGNSPRSIYLTSEPRFWSTTLWWHDTVHWSLESQSYCEESPNNSRLNAATSYMTCKCYNTGICNATPKQRNYYILGVQLPRADCKGFREEITFNYEDFTWQGRLDRDGILQREQYEQRAEAESWPPCPGNDKYSNWQLTLKDMEEENIRDVIWKEGTGNIILNSLDFIENRESLFQRT